MPRKIPLLLLLLAAFGPLGACGQKGPLYLPQDVATPAQPIAAPASTAPTLAPIESNGEEEEGEREEEPLPQTTGADDYSEEEPAPEK
ncbi:LPS translocon maturation chaperone LptM [Microbulbifer rhizosphaerae]|uniref:Putative small lipoprotein YifL n=1 Tax=Microbulbifer rhizosphaerae TaxID=1562603 RepID=A0A7W4WC83_9GAMM|nr:lipoprotein [Microbulbifer rhizosphaerae]MBB3061043.1 putative small lipoprotein YifL [Microbulbifer rhizosphaerae]